MWYARTSFKLMGVIQMKTYIYKLLVKLKLIKLINIKLPFRWLVITNSNTKAFVSLKDAQKYFYKAHAKGDQPLIKPITNRG